jgi:hypothetical protein
VSIAVVFDGRRPARTRDINRLNGIIDAGDALQREIVVSHPA